MTQRIPPPPPLAVKDQAFNRWLLELTNIINTSGVETFADGTTAVTQPTGNNSTLLATTAFVIANAGTPSNANPIMDGVPTPGTGTTWSRNDHVHPTDTSRAPVNSPTFTGDPKAPTPAPGDNDTSVATTAFVQTAIGSLAAVRNGSGVPAAGLGNNGDLYLNNTGGAGTRLYGKIGGAWVAIA